MGIIVRAIGTGVGFVAELSSKKKPSKDNLHTASHPPTRPSLQTHKTAEAGADTTPSESSDTDDSDAEEEDAWILDDTVQRTTSKKHYGIDGQATIDSLVSMVITNSQPAPTQILPLAQPIILPQRRPGTRSRGFVRAYAPILTNHHIDQATFLAFIENLDVAIKASPVLGVVYVGAGITSMVPHGWAMLAGTVAQIIAGVAIEYQQRSRGNSYMDKINDQLFKPRGLYAVIMSYVPNARRPIESIPTDINDLLTNGTRQSGSILGPKLQKGESYGELELPESALLTYPGISQDEEDRLLQEKAVKRKINWAKDYMDRREQARWISQHPESRLNPPEDMQPTFKSKLADPAHPAFQGSWLTLFSGGKIAPRQRLSKDERRVRREARKNARYSRPNAPSTGEQVGSDGTAIGYLRRQRRGKKKKTAKSVSRANLDTSIIGVRRG